MWYSIFGLCFYLWIVFYLFNKNKRYRNKRISTTGYKYLVAIFVLFGVFGVCYGDYFEYGALVKQAYNTYLSYKGQGWYSYIHMEPQYNYLAVICQGNYYLWRFIWILLQFGGLVYLFRKTNLNTYEAFLVFSMCSLQPVCAGRVSWGITFFWLGLYSYLKTKDYKFLLFVFLSLFAHTSMIFLFVLLPAMFIRVNKLNVCIIVIAVPFIAIFLKDIVGNIPEIINIFGNSGYADYLGARLHSGIEGEEGMSYLGNSLGEKIHTVLYFGPLYYMIALFYIDILRKRIIIHDRIKYFVSITFFLFVYTCIVIVVSFNTASLYNRYFSMLFLPIFLLTYGCYKNYYMKRADYKICIITLFLSFVALYLKAAYYYSVNGIHIRADI